MLAACTPAPPVSTANVVLVVGCTVRRDQVGAYAGHAGVTPFLDGLATEGVRFDDPIAAAPWTRAAGTAIFTGHHAVDVGMVEPNDGHNRRRLAASVTTLAERFEAAGYRTVGGTSNPNLNAIYGFDQGYGAYVEPEKTWREDRAKWPGSAFVPALLEQVPRASSQPTFLGAMLVDAHAPFHGAREAWQRFRTDGIPDEVARYRYALHGLDAALSDLEEGLEARGYDASNTLFVVVSDHGEGLSWPEHHGRSHGRYLYSSAIEAIWLARGPRIQPGSTVPGVVSQLDIAPTVLAWAGVSAELPGHAFDLSAPDRRSAPVFSDTWYRDESRAAAWTDETVCMKDFSPTPSLAPTGRFVEGCYDRTTDPRQERVLVEPPAEGIAAVVAWREAHAPRSGESVDDDELDAGLRALGYRE